jgi:hypothetical protein
MDYGGMDSGVPYSERDPDQAEDERVVVLVQ